MPDKATNRSCLYPCLGSSCILIFQSCTEHEVYAAQTTEQYKVRLAEIRPLIRANVPMASDHAERPWPTGHIRSGPTHGKGTKWPNQEGMYVQLATDCSPRAGLVTPPREVTADLYGRAFIFRFCASWLVSLGPMPGGFGQAGRHSQGLYKVGPPPSIPVFRSHASA